MDVNQHYRAPESSSSTHPSQPVGGSIEAALAGDVQWSIGEIFSSAWEQVSGYKGTFWLAMLLYLVIIIALTAVQMALLYTLESPLISAAFELLTNLAIMPLFVGLIMLGIQRAGNVDVSATSILDYYPRIGSIILLNIVMVLLIMIGFVLLILPGIYLSIAYALAFPLLIEKNMGVWEALETSRKAISKCWFRYFGLMITVMLMMIAATLPLGIGLIWALPLGSMVLGVVYVKMFGFGNTQKVNTHL